MRIHYARRDLSQWEWKMSLKEPNSSFLEMLRATGGEAWTRSPLSSLERMSELAVIEGKVPLDHELLIPEDLQEKIESPFLSPEEWRESPHYREGLSFPEGVKESVAEVIAFRRDEEQRRRDIISRGPKGLGATAAMLGTDLLVSALDPLNVAASFVPVVGQARYAGWVSRYGKTVARMMRGGAEGLAGAAMVEPLVLTASKQEQADYDAADSLINLALGPVLGGGLHVTAGALADTLGRLRPRTREGALRAAVGQFVDDRDVNVDPLLMAEDRAQAAKLGPEAFRTRDRVAHEIAPEDMAKLSEMDLSLPGDKDFQVSDDEVTHYMRQFQRYAETRRAEGKLTYTEERLLNNQDELAMMAKEYALIDKRNEAFKTKRKQALLDYMGRFDSPGKGLASKIAGSNKPVAGARLSTDARHQALANEYLGGLLTDLRREGLDVVWRKNLLEREVALELRELPGGRVGISGSPQAKRIAAIINRWQMLALRRMNRAGAYIKSLHGYTARQVHDLDKIRRAGFDAWSKKIVPLLDHGRTFKGMGPKEAQEMLQEAYFEIIEGRTFEVSEEAGEDLAKVFGQNIAKKASAHRGFHFKDADAFLSYSKEFGAGGLTSAIHRGFEAAARTTALLEDFGPNPEKLFEEILEGMALKGPLGRASRRHLRNLFAEVTGLVNVPVSNRGATLGRMTRMMHNMSKLGGVLLSSLADPACVSSEFMHLGSRVLGAYGKTLQAFLQGHKKGARREIADLIGVGLDGLRGGILSRFANDDMVPGAMSRMMETFFRLSGLTWWNDSWKRGVGLMISRDLAGKRKTAWRNLDDKLRSALEKYDIGRREWRLIRHAPTVKDEAGTGYITPTIVDQVEGFDIAEHLRLDPGEVGINPAVDREIRRFRDELSTKIRSFIVDRVDFAILTPGAREQAVFHYGTQPGTALGEAFRLFWQYKSFPFAFASKLYGREFGRGKISGALGVVHLSIAATVLGYLARTAKDVSRGRTPRDPKDPNTWKQAFIQGGGAGIYGDFFFGDYTRFGHGGISTALGPTATTIEDIVKLTSRAMRGDDAGAQGLRVAIRNTPFANLFYTRAALDYLLFYQLQEMLNPGYLHRMETAVKNFNRQTFMVPPSQVIPYGGGPRYWRR